MLMSTIDATALLPTYPEIAGKRVLITGLTKGYGIDVAHALARHKARLVLQVAHACEEMQAAAEMLSAAALDLRLFAAGVRSVDDIVPFVRTAVTAFGGIDAVVNLIPLGTGDLAASATHEDLEAAVSQRLLLPALAGKIGANRMRLTHTEGLVLNVAVMPDQPTSTDRAVATMAKAALAAMTRTEAAAWAGEGIRFNAICPQVADSREPGLTGEVDVASLALYLTSGRGKALSGHVFESAASAIV